MKYCILIDDPEDVKRVERFLSEARNLRIDIEIFNADEKINGYKDTIMFCDQGQMVSYFVRAELEEGSEATGADGSRWP